MKAITALRIAAILALVAAITLILIFLPVKQYLFSLLEWVRGLGVWGPAFIVGAYVLACVVFAPGWILTVGAGFLFGLVVGTITVSIGSVLGATAAFLLGRTLARDWVATRVAQSRKFRAIDEAVRRHGFKIVLLIRLSPVFPFNLLNYAFGLTKVSLRDYVLASWIGMFPATVLYVYLGSALQSLTDLTAGQPEGGTALRILRWVGLGVTVIVTMLVTRIARNALRQEVPIDENASSKSTQGDAHAQP